MPLRNAQIADLPCIVEIAIPGRQGAADTTPVTVASREPWFREFDPERRPLWLLERDAVICGWLWLRSFYGRPAYRATVEAAVYTAPEARRTGVGAELLASLALFRRIGFRGKLPRVAELDGIGCDLLVVGLRTG